MGHLENRKGRGRRRVFMDKESNKQHMHAQLMKTDEELTRT